MARRAARIDEHRYGHALAAHADHKVGVGPVEWSSYLPPQPAVRSSSMRHNPCRIIEVKAPSAWTDVGVQEHPGYRRRLVSFLDVPEWRSRAATLLSGLTLDKRMYACETFVWTTSSSRWWRGQRHRPTRTTRTQRRTRAVGRPLLLSSPVTTLGNFVWSIADQPRGV